MTERWIASTDRAMRLSRPQASVEIRLTTLQRCISLMQKDAGASTEAFQRRALER
jgi:hypothetical protein